MMYKYLKFDIQNILYYCTDIIFTLFYNKRGKGHLPQNSIRFLLELQYETSLIENIPSVHNSPSIGHPLYYIYEVC